jgi:hypothetical protein
MFIFLTQEAAKMSMSGLSPEERSLGAPLTPAHQVDVEIYASSFTEELYGGAPGKHVGYMRAAITKIYTAMANGSFDWNALEKVFTNSAIMGDRASNTAVGDMKVAYYSHLAETGDANVRQAVGHSDERLRTLFIEDDKQSHSMRLRNSIAFTPPRTTSSLNLGDTGLTTGRINNVLHLLTRNFMNRSFLGHYLPNDAWWVPPVSEVVLDEGIRPGLILDPVLTIQSLRRGLSDDVAERMILQEHFGIRGDVSHIIRLMGDVDPNLMYHQNGTKLSKEEMKAFRQSVGVLEEKYAFIRGQQEESRSYGTLADYLYEMAPAITKVAFAGNLAFASLSVEHVMNTLVTMVGEGQIFDGIRTAFTPLFHGLSGEETKLVSEDFLDLVESVAVAMTPTYETVASEASQYTSVKVMNAWAGQALRLPKHVLSATVTARLITMRKAMYDLYLNRPDVLLAFATEWEATTPTTRSEKKALFKKHDISFMRYGKLIEYYRKAGVFHPNRLNMVMNIMQQGDIKGKYFSLGKATAHLTQTESGGSSNYRNQLEIEGAIKSAESEYIHEVMVHPHAFDIYTGTDRFGRSMEIFRRFPVLWVGQMLFRRSNKTPVIAMAGLVISMLLLDLMYMMGLRIAAGNSIEDLEKDMKDKGISGFLLFYGARLPIFGRYYGQMAAALAALSRGKEIPSGFIPGAATASVIKNLYMMGSGMWGTEGISQQELLNAARILPVLGDTLIRMGIYGAWGDEISKKNTQGSSFVQSNQYPEQHMGLDYGRDESYEAVIADLLKEWGIKPNWPRYESEFTRPMQQSSIRERRDLAGHIRDRDVSQQSKASQEVPPSSPQQPAIDSADPIESIRNMGPLKIPDGLID